MGKLLWLASYPKSGNTWVRSFLYNLLHDTQEPADINKLNTFCFGASSRRWFDEVSDRPLEALTPEEIAHLRPEVSRKMAAAKPNAIPVKTHNYLGDWFGVPMHDMALTAGAVYIVRNPLDLVLSLAPHRAMTVDEAIDFIATPGIGTKLGATHVPEVYDTWSNHVLSWTAKQSPALVVLRYEDLLSDPHKAFAPLARFVGAGGDEARLDRAIRHSSFEVLKAQETQHGFQEKPSNAEAFFREGRLDQWQEKLTPEQVMRIVASHREQMERFGYVPAGY